MRIFSAYHILPNSLVCLVVPYIVGMHPNSPANPHSALATGASPADIANIDTVPTQEAYVLYGGVVGGPDAQDRFWDMRSDWVQNEVALDYVAPVLTLAARAIVEGTSDPWYTRLDVGSNEQRKPGGQPCDAAVSDGCTSKGKGWRVGKIVMASLVSAIGMLVLSIGAFWMFLVWRYHNGKV